MAKSSKVSESKSLPANDPAIALENASGVVPSMSQSDGRPKLTPTLGKLGCGPIILDFHSLANGRSEIFISLDGEAYRLRLTRNNKLILTK